MLVLELLDAYDLSKNVEFLESAIYISKWLCENENVPAYSLNYLQAVKRSRILRNEENLLLVNIRNTAETDEIALGACILLESYIEAEQVWNKLPSENQKTFANFPIYRLWKHEVSSLQN